MGDFNSDIYPKARKQHKCCECRGIIQVGDIYQRSAGCGDGGMFTYKTCSPCVETRDWATDQMEWGGADEHLYYFTMLENDMSELASEIRSGSGRKFKAYRLQIAMGRRRSVRTNRANES